jgi:putative methionine-R-sulfoxide reductase with GAF domain
MKEGELGRLYKDGEIICREGEEGKYMYVIQSGKVEVKKKVPDGELPLTTLKKGEIFGEMALFDLLPRSATVRAVGEAMIMSVDKKGFFSRVSKDPTLAFKILEGMSKRIRSLNDELMKFKEKSKEVMTTKIDLRETCTLVLDEIKNSLKADNGSIMLLDEKNKGLTLMAAFGTDSPKKTDLKVGTGIAGDVVKTGKIELINNISADPRFLPGDMKVKALLCAPLKRTDNVFGVINLSHSKGNFFNLDDLKLLRVLAIYASIAIDNARLFSTSQKLSDSLIKHVTLLDIS